MTSTDELREHVRDRYGAAAAAVGSGSGQSCCGPADALSAISDRDESEVFGAGLYEAGQTDGLPAEAVLASLGCGNPLAVADLRAGEKVLDLGSGGGIDVLLSAARVGPTGFAYGLDMTDQMLELARTNASRAAATNVEFLKGQIEQIPLPDSSIDVIISNCVINLSTDKPAVLAEMFRVLAPAGRIGISDVVAEDRLTPAERAERGSYVGCIAGALSSISEYLDGLTAAGFVGCRGPVHPRGRGRTCTVRSCERPNRAPPAAAPRPIRPAAARPRTRPTAAEPPPPAAPPRPPAVAGDHHPQLDRRATRGAGRTVQAGPVPAGLDHRRDDRWDCCSARTSTGL